MVRRSASALLPGGAAIVALVAACGGESTSSEDASGGTAGSHSGASGGTGGVSGGSGGGGGTGASGGSGGTGGTSGGSGGTGGTNGGSGGTNGGSGGMTGGTGAVGGASGGSGGSGAVGGSVSGAAGMSGSGGRCPDGVEIEVDRLCIRGVPTDGGEYIAEGTEFRIELYPQGCFSSSCTTVLDVTCTVTVSGDELLVDGAICHGTSRVGDAVPCTDDCGGGGMTECLVEPLAAQRYFAIYEDLIVAFEVPSLVEPGGRCVSAILPGPPPRDRWPAQSPEPPTP